jgi:hypothetical protein
LIRLGSLVFPALSVHGPDSVIVIAAAAAPRLFEGVGLVSRPAFVEKRRDCSHRERETIRIAQRHGNQVMSVLPRWAVETSTLHDLFVAQGRDVREHAFATTSVAALTGRSLSLTLDKLISHLLRVDYVHEDPHFGRSILWMGTECYVQMWNQGMGMMADDDLEWPIEPPEGFRQLVNLNTCSRGPRRADRLFGNPSNEVHSFIVYGTDEDAAGYQKMTQLLCRLIAADDNCRHVAVGYHKLADEDDDEDFETTDLPLDVEALETLVTQVGSERGFSISDDFFLWGEHEDVLLLNGHGNIRLWIGIHIAGELAAALNEQRSPSKLSLTALGPVFGSRRRRHLGEHDDERSAPGLRVPWCQCDGQDHAGRGSQPRPARLQGGRSERRTVATNLGLPVRSPHNPGGRHPRPR